MLATLATVATVALAQPVAPSDLQLPAELVAEPVTAPAAVIHPLAIDWDRRGRLYVAEWIAPATGVADAQPTSRIKLLTDTNGDGFYDQAALFLDDLPLVTSLKTWRNGLLIAAAPDLLYAEDTSDDQQADTALRLFVGFGVELPSQQFNSLTLGPDGWLYAANGRSGGIIRSLASLTSLSSSNSHPPTALPDVNLTANDFRFHLDTGQLEPVSGFSQTGRARNDWGDWFGSDAEGRCWHFPMPLRYSARNPAVPPPDPAMTIVATKPTTPEKPAAGLLPQPAPSTGWLAVYRDDLLGSNYHGNLFLARPTFHSIERWRLEPRGTSFQTVPPADSNQINHRNFLLSTDRTFTPQQIQTGPDGALWIVDAGSIAPAAEPPSAGNLWRVRPRNAGLRAIVDLTRLTTAQLVEAFPNPNGAARDRLREELFLRGDPDTAVALAALISAPPPARDTKSNATNQTLHLSQIRPAAQADAFFLLQQLNSLHLDQILPALQHPQPEMRRVALLLLEPYLRAGHPLPAILESLTRDPNLHVRYQLALSLGEANNPSAVTLLARLLLDDSRDPWIRAAVLSSAQIAPDRLLQALLAHPPADPSYTQTLLASLLHTIAAAKPDTVEATLRLLTANSAPESPSLRLEAAGLLLESLQSTLPAQPNNTFPPNSLLPILRRFSALIAQARILAHNPATPPDQQRAAFRLLGWDSESLEADLETLAAHLAKGATAELRDAALTAFIRPPGPAGAHRLVQSWAHLRPSLRPRLIGHLASRDGWIRMLLDAVDQGYLAATEISPANRERLLNHAQAATRDHARQVFQTTLPPRRPEILERFSTAAGRTGNPQNGASVFAQNCTMCHSLAGQGHTVGPNLATIGQRSTTELIESILDPNASIEPRYLSHQVETRDDRALSGVLENETEADLTLVQGGGLRETLTFDNIAQIRVSNFSLMPEGFEHSLTAESLANLARYLQTVNREPPRPAQLEE